MSKKKTQQKGPVSKKDQQISEPQCCCSRQKSSTRIRCDKNRVTIFGQVGQNENNKYTLEYAAKINDMPMSPEFFSQYYNKLDDQEDIEENLKQVASHAVQVNIREHLQQPDRRLPAGNDQGIQCNFENLSLVPDFHDVDDSKETEDMKKCNSPVIVISVYPRPDVKISTDKVFKISKPKFAKKYSSNVVPAANSKTSKEKKEIFQNRRSQSRSASPEAKEIEKDSTKDNLQQRALRSKMKSSFNLSSTNRKIIKSEPQKGNKNDTTELKQTLIDNFIKSMESEEDNYAKFLLSVPKSTASRITINLNKNKHSFDVASNSSKKEVDLENIKNKFKDTRKPLADKKISINCNKVISEKRSPKTNKGKMNTKSSYPKTLQLKPRDSLVVKHSREIRRSEIGESVQKINGEQYGEQKSRNADARKHYRGDNCPIDDPNVRDKEIQRLLGLTKKQTTRLSKASKTYQHCGLKKCSKAIIISVKKKRLPRSPFTQTNNIDQNNVLLETLNVNWNEKLVKVKGLSRSPTTFDKTDNCINRALKSNSHRIDKGTKIISNVLRNPESSHLRTNQPRLIYDYDFFHAQKPYKYRSKIPIKRYNKNTMTARNAVVNHLASNRDKHHSLLKAVPVKIERTNRKLLHFSKEIQTDNKYFEKYVQTEKKSIAKKQFKMVHDSNCKIKRNFNRLLNIDSERIIIHQDKNKICLRPTVSAVDASNNYNSNLKLETPKLYINQKGDGPDLKSKKQADVANPFHVIYKGKGQKRAVTPNLGTSFVSSSVKSSKGTHQRPHRGRKTFLLNIISYIIKKLKRSSSMLENHQLKKCSTPNSFDSYYVNSSLAPWDMSSVIYDTSVSYYSNHSIHAVAKMKRGFLSSFCDVLARTKRQVGK